MSISGLPRQTLCLDGLACGPSAHLPCWHQQPSAANGLDLLPSMEVAMSHGLCQEALNEPFDQNAREYLGL